MSTVIHVHCQLPHRISPGLDLNLDPSNWDWVHCLTIPVQELRDLRFCHRPYKWIRYAIGVVLGAQGDLSTTADSEASRLNIVDYEAGQICEPADQPEPLVEELPIQNLYYHLSDEEKRRMYPLDPHFEYGTNTVTSAPSTRREDFYSQLKSRQPDGCTFSFMRAEECYPAHLVRHFKGDNYISNFTQRRSRDPAHGDAVESVDSVRNGLLLNPFTQRTLGVHVAFLPTPNFAMDTSDIIDPAEIPHPPSEKRYTGHMFTVEEDHYLGCFERTRSGVALPRPDIDNHSTSTKESNTELEWPPDILFDAVYASAVLRHFGVSGFKDAVSSKWDDAFFVNCPRDADGAVLTTEPHADHYTEERVRKRLRREILSRPGPPYFEWVPFQMVRWQEVRSYLVSEAIAAIDEQERVRDKVEAWMRQVFIILIHSRRRMTGALHCSECDMFDYADLW